ncbi:MAG: hypothetical protein AAGC77_09690 [Pseudomonadota bacterium]
MNYPLIDIYQFGHLGKIRVHKEFNDACFEIQKAYESDVVEFRISDSPIYRGALELSIRNGSTSRQEGVLVFENILADSDADGKVDDAVVAKLSERVETIPVEPIFTMI